MDVSENSGTPKSSHFNRVFHYFHHPFWDSPIFGNTHIHTVNEQTSTGKTVRIVQTPVDCACDTLCAGYTTPDSEDPYGGMTMTRYQGLLAEILEVVFDSKTEGILPKKGDVFVDVLYFS